MQSQRESTAEKPTWIVHPASSRALPGAEAPLATVFTSGSAHEVRHANAAFCTLVGLPYDCVAGRPLAELFHGHAVDVLRTFLDMVLESGNPNVASDIAVDGDRSRFVTALASPVENDTHELGLFVHLVDTTDAVVARVTKERIAADVQQANEALLISGLREQEAAERARGETERWNALVANLSEGVAVFDGSGRVILVNDVGRKLLDMENGAEDDFFAHCELTYLDGAPLPPECHPARRALAGDSFVDWELLHVRAPSERCRLVFSGSSVRDANGTALAINVFRDVTELRKLEETRGEFVSLVSHDIRSPLQALLGSAELLIEALEGIDLPRVNARAETILRVTRRLSGMIDDLYRTTKLEAANVPLSFARVDIATLAETIYESAADAHSRGRIRFELDRDLPPIEVDKPKMERALLNLVTNALKYSDEDVTLRARAVNDELVIDVIDRGEGILPEERPYIFEKYRRTRRAQRIEGLGLGLYITRRIVELHGGRIACESKVGEGSTFTVTLPIAHRSAR